MNEVVIKESADTSPEVASVAEVSVAAVAETAASEAVAEAAAETAVEAAETAVAVSQEAVAEMMQSLERLRDNLTAHMTACQVADDNFHARLLELEDAETEPETEPTQVEEEPALEKIELVQPETNEETAPSPQTKRRKFRKL